MSRYGISFYGTDTYGAAQLINFDASPFTAKSSDYNSIFLQWTLPSGNWTRIRLVRSSYGYPVNESDGTVLLDLNCGPIASSPLDMSQTSYLDSGLASGQFYYYSIFVYGILSYNNRDDWRRAGDVTGLSVTNWGYTSELVKHLPTIYTTNLNASQSQSADTDTSIYRFLSLMGFQLDYIRSEYESLLLVNDPSRVAGGLLPLLAKEFGLAYEPEVGMEQLRVLLRNIVHIYKNKGTSIGIEALIESFTGWSSTVNQGTNLMLDYNESSFEEGIGHWVGAVCTVAYYPADGSIAAFSTGVNKTGGLIKATATSSSNFSITNGLTNSSIIGVPVIPTVQYTLSCYSRAATTPRSMGVSIRYFDQFGVLISSTVSSGVTDATGTWTRNSLSTAAPSNAAYAGFSIGTLVAPTAGEIHYFDAVQFEASSSASVFQEARDLRITLQASRINESINPSFQTSTAGWTATGTTTITRSLAQGLYASSIGDTATTTTGSATVSDVSIVAGDLGKSVSGAGIPLGAYVGTVTPGTSFLLSSSSSSQVSVTATLTGSTSIIIRRGASGVVVTDASASPVYQTTPIIPGNYTYTVSAWVYGAAGTYSIRHTQGTPTAGSNILNGTGTVVAANTWTRISGTFTVPSTELTARWNIIGPASSTYYLDGVLIERGSGLNPFFDGAQGVTHPADYIWEGTANLSRSHYYQARTAKTFRLSQLLTDYMWNGMTFTLLVAQPGT